MAIVTTYVCDVSGKTGMDRKDFIDVKITADNSNVVGVNYGQRMLIIQKLVHIDAAHKLGLVVAATKEDVQPQTPTFESQIASLMKQWAEEIAYEAAESAAMSARNG